VREKKERWKSGKHFTPSFLVVGAFSLFSIFFLSLSLSLHEDREAPFRVSIFFSVLSWCVMLYVHLDLDVDVVVISFEGNKIKGVTFVDRGLIKRTLFRRHPYKH
jgi:hypothetical protein